MQKVILPKIESLDVYDVCIKSISEQRQDLKSRLRNAKGEIDKRNTDYNLKAQQMNLHEIEPFRGGAEDTVILNLRKSELTGLYTNQLVPANKTEGRKYYDQIMISAPYERCPACRVVSVSSIDHYLAKKYYPALSLHVGNLVPMCEPCNRLKHNNLATSKDQLPLHPRARA